MRLKVYSIHDQKTGIFNRPFYNHTHGEAERNFSELVRDDKSTISKHPEDYDLYFLGEYDDNAGVFEPLETPHHIVKAIQFVTDNK